jgi:D-glycero-D-manno-heptose 1,7-bisphosphate phosphatase
MVGDKLLDAETARNAGARGVLVRTGYGRDEERRLEAEDGTARPERVADDLLRATEWIVGRDAD